MPMWSGHRIRPRPDSHPPLPGIALGVMFVVWFVSGIVMMTRGCPSVRVRAPRAPSRNQLAFIRAAFTAG